MKNEKTIILIDRKSIPPWATFSEILKFKNDFGVVIYDSSLGGNKPSKVVFSKRKGENDFVEFLDVAI